MGSTARLSTPTGTCLAPRAGHRLTLILCKGLVVRRGSQERGPEWVADTVEHNRGALDRGLGQLVHETVEVSPGHADQRNTGPSQQSPPGT